MRMIPHRAPPSASHRDTGADPVVAAAAVTSVLAAAVLLLLAVLWPPTRSTPELAAAVVEVWAAPAAPPTSINQLLGNLRGFIVGISAGLATLFLSVGAVRYMWANGDPGEIEKAKRSFHGAAIGYGVAVLAPLGVAVLQGIVGTG